MIRNPQSAKQQRENQRKRSYTSTGSNKTNLILYFETLQVKIIK